MTCESCGAESDDQTRRAIRFGLGAVKGVGAKAVAAIVSERTEDGPFETLFDFAPAILALELQIKRFAVIG